jgi:hypothetical protein
MKVSFHSQIAAVEGRAAAFGQERQQAPQPERQRERGKKLRLSGRPCASLERRFCEKRMLYFTRGCLLCMGLFSHL